MKAAEESQEYKNFTKALEALYELKAELRGGTGKAVEAWQDLNAAGAYVGAFTQRT